MQRASNQSASMIRSVTAALLCALLPGQFGQFACAQIGTQVGSALGARLGTQTGKKPAPVATIESSPDAAKPTTDPRILHLLSRFTFGPTTEEIAYIHALDGKHDGKHDVDQWFEQQLHPDRIPISTGDRFLADRLSEFPALLLPVDELLARFPSGAMIRQSANGKLPIPDDPYLYAIYRRHIGMFEEKQAQKEQSKATPESPKPAPAKQELAGKMNITAPPAVETNPAATTEPAKPTPTKPETASAARPAYADLLVKNVLALPPAKRVQRILYMQPAEYEQFHSALKGPQKSQLIADLNPVERELLSDFDNPTRTIVEELQAQRLLRDIYSSHQLEEVMTTFWLNHFNVYLHKNEETPYYLVNYERDVIAPRALGNFEDLLVAVAKSPAMLLYLDNSSSTGPDSVVSEKQKERAALGKATKATPPGLNENYARELMELHTLGVNGGYTQADVTEVAKVFTGWTVDRPQLGGGFKFDETRHEPGKKLVLGHVIKESGQKEGLHLLHLLATNPATAHFISQKLAVAFVSDNPPPALVNRMAQTFLAKNGEIAAVLRTMVHSPEFWTPEAYQAKVKTPLEYVVSAARASGANITNAQPLVNALNQMGMPLYACVPPTGYSDKADTWVSTGELVTRMNFALSLATNHFGGVRPQWAPASLLTGSPTEAEQNLEAQLIPAGVSEKTRAAVLNQNQSAASAQVFPQPVTDQSLSGKPPTPAGLANAIQQQNGQIAGLLLGSPEFQRR
ncbi:DUF1800 domain-containing protein [Acidicapsa acidisoli]|uniref:DUF1800 domain-containing protein n=1 Tax=Acidicapsa acidisoli TaxID=1615681 RepID=UPI0021E0B9AC|nr:DUF1800 family protein [Acidicapsa acidisoli]